MKKRLHADVVFCTFKCVFSHFTV